MRKEARKPGRSQTENLPCPMKFVFSLGAEGISVYSREKTNLLKCYFLKMY